MNRLRTILRIGGAVGLLGVLFLGAAAPAAAHVDLIESDPPDQAQLAESPAVVELIFNESVTPAGDGIQLVDATGAVIETALSQPSDQRLEVAPQAPLSEGTYGILWTVRAGDAHPRSGSIVFTVTPTDESADVALEPKDDAPTDGEATPPATTLATEPPEPGAEAAGSPEPTPVEPTPQGTVSAPRETSEAAFVASLSAAPPATGEWLSRIGRWISFTGALVAIGALVFATFALTGSRREVREAAFWVRRSGLAVIVGAVLEAVGTSFTLQGSIMDGMSPSGLVSTFDSSFGLALLLRVTGGLAVLFGMRATARPISTVKRSTPEPATRAGTGAVDTLARPEVDSTPYRLDVMQSRGALVGVAAVAVSYLFDGHTVTASPVWLVRLADLIHVIAAGVWVGGVFMLGWLLIRRRRQHVPLPAAELAIRFSPIATLALGAVAVAGVALTWTILDTPGELVGTAWGRTLIAKLVVVGAAAVMGGYNHRTVVPRLSADSEDERAGDMLRSVVRIEGAVLFTVVAITALLVGAAS